MLPAANYNIPVTQQLIVVWHSGQLCEVCRTVPACQSASKCWTSAHNLLPSPPPPPISLAMLSHRLAVFFCRPNGLFFFRICETTLLWQKPDKG